MRELILKLLDYSNLRELVEDNIRWALRNRRMLKEEDFSPEPLGTIVGIVITRGYWRLWPKQYLVNKLRAYGIHVRDDELILNFSDLNAVLKALEELRNEYGGAFWEKTLRSIEALINGLRRAGSLERWVSKLHELVSRRSEWKDHEYFRGIYGLGDKGANLILRDMGYFDRVPIDIHERRFLVRTGIASVYGPPTGDPSTPDFYSEALRRYCKENLEGIKILGVPLSESPGVIDWAIWYFSCEKENKDCKAICASKPKCNECPLKNICLYGRYRN